MSRPALIAFPSDEHVNSTVGLCPPGGIRLDDGPVSMPSESQLWLWERWQMLWSEIDDIRTRHGANLGIVNVGDLTEGFHHRSQQIHSASAKDQHRAAIQAMQVPMELRPDWLEVIRGTEAHCGPNGQFEEAIAAELGAVPDESGNNFSHWHRQYRIHGRIIDVGHHGRGWSRPWTKGTAVNTLAAEVVYDYADDRANRPDLLVRGDQHRFNDSGMAHPVRVVHNGCFQLSTAFIHRIAVGKLPSIGAWSCLIFPDGEMVMRKHQFHFKRTAPVDVEMGQ